MNYPCAKFWFYCVDRQTDRQTDRQAGRQAGRQVDRQNYTQTRMIDVLT